MRRRSLLLISPQGHVSQGILDVLERAFEVQHFSQTNFKVQDGSDESILMAFPGVDISKLGFVVPPLLCIRLQSCGEPKNEVSGWTSWNYETPLSQWVTRLQSQYQKLLRQKDSKAQKRLRQTLAQDGESACIYELLKLWKDWTRSENVFWLPNSDVLMAEDQRKTSLDPDIRSLLPRTEAEMKAVFTEIAPPFLHSKKTMSFHCSSARPLSWARSGCQKGIFLFERPLRWNTDRIAQLIAGQTEVLKLVHQFSLLRRQTVTDDLTGLYNHRHLFPCLEYEIERTAKLESQFSILFIDVDRFKQVNDQHGHLIGSELLSQLGTLMRRRTRTTDLSFRYGGDEYLIILRGAKGQDAEVVGERLRKAVDQADFEVGGRVFKLTLSIGIATYPENATTSEEIIRIADEAMYSGKRKSRNIVQRAS